MLSLSLLACYFQGTIPVSALEAAVGVVPVAKLGGSSPVYLREDQAVVVMPADVRALLLAYLAGELSNSALAVVADALGMSERVTFAPEQVRDVLECATDPEINGPLDYPAARALLQQLTYLVTLS